MLLKLRPQSVIYILSANPLPSRETLDIPKVVYSNGMDEDEVMCWKPVLHYMVSSIAIMSSVAGCVLFDRHANYSRDELPVRATYIVPSDIGSEIYISGGCYVMGTPVGHSADEPRLPSSDSRQLSDPTHRECVPPFKIGKYEVTASEFCEFLQHVSENKKPSDYIYVDPIQHRTTIEFREGRYLPRRGYEYDPATSVTYMGARRYCEWLSETTGNFYRLPTEIEWEFVAQGSTDRKTETGAIAHGDQYHARVQFMSSASYGEHTGTITVGNFPEGATPEGVHELLGNAMEWCGNYFYEYSGNPNAYGRDELRALATPEIPLKTEVHEGYRTVCRGFRLVNDKQSASRRILKGTPHVHLIDDDFYSIGFRVLREVRTSIEAEGAGSIE